MSERPPPLKCNSSLDDFGYDQCTKFEDSPIVLKHCFARDPGDVCDCPTWFGFVGENCDVTSIQLCYYRGISLIFFIMGLSILVYDIFLIFQVWKYYSIADVTHRKRLFGARIPLLLFFALAKNILFMTYVFINIIASYSPTQQVLFKLESLLGSDRSFEYVYAVSGPLFVISLYGSSSFLFIQTVIITTSWIQLIRMLPSFMAEFKYHSIALYFEKLAPYFSIAFMLIWIILLTIGYFGDVVFVAAVFGVIFLFLFIIARNDFVKTVESSKLRINPNMYESLKLVQRTSFYIIFFWVLLWITAFFNVLTGQSFRRNGQPGQFNHSMFFQDLATGAGIGLSLTSTYYVTRLLDNFGIDVLPATPTTAVNSFRASLKLTRFRLVTEDSI